jgi:hypothetical protein
VIRDEETGVECRAAKIFSSAKHETAGPMKNIGAKFVIRYPNAYLKVEGETAWIKEKK